MARIDGRLPNHNVTIPKEWLHHDPDRVIVKPVAQTHELEDPLDTIGEIHERIFGL